MMRSSMIALIVAGGGIAVPALAQEAPATSKAAPQSDANVGEIIVTATRRAESLQNVPIAVQAISPQQIQSTGVISTTDLVRLAPSLTFQNGSTTKLKSFSIRGIGSFVTSDGFDQSVGIALDSVPLARPGGSIADLVDIERVEVLEGPQGMLFGRNASAGLVNIITRKPELGVTSVSGRAYYGSYDDSQISATVNASLSDALSVRVTGWRYRHDGYVDAPLQNRTLGTKDSGGARLRALWKPDDRFSALLTGEITSFDQDASIYTIREFVNNRFDVQAYETSVGIVASPTNEVTSTRDPLNSDGNTKSITAELSYDLNGPVLSSVTSYRRISVFDKFSGASTSAPNHLTSQADDITYRQFSQELRLNKDSGRLRYVLGLIYFKLDIDDFFYSQVSGSVPTPVAINVLSEIESSHYAAFGELTFDITPELRAIAGGRYSHDKISASFDKVYRAPPVSIVPGFNSPGGAFGPLSVDTSVSDSEPSYRFGLQYDAAPDVMLYATASRGYKAAGLDLVFNLTQAAFDVDRSRVKPEIAKNLEFGVRSQFFDRRLTINATAFFETFSDFQVAVRLPVAANLYNVKNAKQMKTSGVSMEVTARPFDGFSLSTNAAYVNARFTDFDNAACYPNQPTAPVGTPKTPGICVGGEQSLNGKPLAKSPRWRLNATARQDFSVGDWDAFLQANWQYQSKEVFNAVADPRERQGGFSLVNLAAGIGPSDDRWKISVYGNNIFDRKFVLNTNAQNTGSYFTQVVPYEARARWGVAVDFDF